MRVELRWIWVVLLIILGLPLGQTLAQGGIVFLPVVLGSGTILATPVPGEVFRRDGTSADYYPFLIYNAESPEVKVATLQQIAGDATTDTEIISRVVKYYNTHAGELEAGWREHDSARLKALFAMYLIHISHSYGVAPYPNTSFVDYLKQPFSNCGPQSWFEAQIMGALGLRWQRVGFQSGLHGWTEVQINGTWEIFDATGNVWVSQGSFDLLNGGARQYRQFYTPWSDLTRPEARQVLGGQEGSTAPFQYTPAGLRNHMPGLGINFFELEYRQRTGDGLIILDMSQ